MPRIRYTTDNSTNEDAVLGFIGVRAVAERAASLVDLGTSDNTRRSYATSWDQWSSFVRATGREPLECTQEEAVSLLLVWIGELRNKGLSVATIKARMAGVAAGYSDARLDVRPTDDRHVRRALAKEAAERGERRQQAEGLSGDDLRKVVSLILPEPRGLRDRAFLLLTFHGMLRLDELCTLRRKQVEFCDGGLVLRITRPKTDQTGKGAKIPVRAGKGALCAVTAMAEWFRVLDQVGIVDGPIFRSVNRGGGIGSSALTERGAFEIFRSRGKDAGIEGLSVRQIHALAEERTSSFFSRDTPQ